MRFKCGDRRTSSGTQSNIFLVILFSTVGLQQTSYRRRHPSGSPLTTDVNYNAGSILLQILLLKIKAHYEFYACCRFLNPLLTARI